MQIKIEIDVKPEELRRFLGLPDVAGLQEDLVQFLRDKLGAASDGFDPASFVKDNLQSLRDSAAWRKIVSAAKASTVVNVAVPDRKAGGRQRVKRDPAAGKPVNRKTGVNRAKVSRAAPG